MAIDYRAAIAGGLQSNCLYTYTLPEAGVYAEKCVGLYEVRRRHYPRDFLAPVSTYEILVVDGCYLMRDDLGKSAISSDNSI